MNKIETLEEFEAQYARKSNVTVEFLHKNNQHGVPCDCGDETCQGWAMVNKESHDKK
jgi:hypothetical protein